MDGKWIIFSFCIVGACCASDNLCPLFVGASCARDLFLQLGGARDNR